MFEAFLVLAIAKLVADHRDNWGPWLLLTVVLALLLVVASLFVTCTRLF